MLIDDARPSIDTYHWNNPSLFIRERKNLFGERVQAVLICNHQERHHLLIGRCTTVTLLECCCF
ncbi:Uncharacterised protein [Vibrio cholerae]|nr:Uncharacterised protein [Vibrio cholerae]